MHRLTLMLVTLFVAACGSETPQVLQGRIAEDIATLSPGESKSYPFNINLKHQVDPALIVGVGSTDEASNLDVIVLTEPEFQLYDSGQTFTPRFSTTTPGSDLNILINIAGDYRLVVSNPSDVTPVQYVLIADIFWQEP